MSAMDILPEIERRRAFRSIGVEPVSDEAVARMLSAATMAPSCYNNQPWRFVAVADAEQLRKIGELLPDGNAWARSAPLILLAFTKPSLDCRQDEGRDYALFDLGLATMSLILQAEHEGLVAHPIAGFTPKKVKAVCGLEDDHVLIALIVCGKRGDNPNLAEWQKEREKGPRLRKELSAVTFRDRYSKEG